MDLVKSIQSVLYERIASPLAGIFILSWLAMHYDLVMMLMSKNDMVFKSELIHQHLIVNAKYNWGGWWCSWLAPYFYGLFLPLVISFVGLFFYSCCSIPAFWVQMFTKVTLQNIKIEKEGQVLVPRSKHEEICDKYKERIEELQDREIKNDNSMEKLKKLYQDALGQHEVLQAQIDEMLAESNIAHDEGRVLVASDPVPSNVKAVHSHSFSLPDVEGYEWLMLDSDDASLNRKILLIIKKCSAGGSTPINPLVILRELRMPSTNENTSSIRDLCILLSQYHLVEGHTEFRLSKAGIEMTAFLEEEADILREYCMGLDAISDS